jgi:predicted ATPase
VSDQVARVVPFVRRLRVRDYKSIASCDVSFGPLTVLAGFNATGKSNIIDALRFVRDALARSPAQALSTRGGLDSVLRRAEMSDAPGSDERRASQETEVAASFMIGLELALVTAEGVASYELEIGQDPAGEFEHLVLRETFTSPSRGGKLVHHRSDQRSAA